LFLFCHSKKGQNLTGLDDDKQDWMKNTSPRNDKEDKKELGCLGIKFREPVRL